MYIKKFSFIRCMITILFIAQCIYNSNSFSQRYDQTNNTDNGKSINTLSKYTVVDNKQIYPLPSKSVYMHNLSQVENNNKTIISEDALKMTSHLPQWFQYRDINEDALKSYLANKSSILKEEPYFSSIINVGKDFNINPILLFSITGQEQGFVPKEELSASLIANNPYNVFCSWQSYNTDIIDSSEIACRTIINLSKNRPDSVDPLVWINQKYSADQNWHSGVRYLYNDILNYVDKYEKGI